jgi:hypothetical protein
MINKLLGCWLLLALSSCSNPSSIMKLPDQPGQKISDSGVEVFDPSVDILFVIDNSGSMGGHQANLSANVSRFIANFTQRSALNFHIGVVSTDMDGYFAGKSQCCGNLIGSPNFVDKSTPNFNQVLQQNMILGTNGSSEEHSFDPVYAALTLPNLTGSNDGFYRPGAHLAVVIMTDAEDQSHISVNDFYNFLVGLKNRADRVSVYGVIVPSNDTTDCPRDEEGVTPQRIEALLGKVANAGANEMNICAPDFGDKLAAMGDDLLKRVASVVYLNRRPAPGTIHVTFGTQIIPADPVIGWTYDSFVNAIRLGDKIQWTIQPQGTQVKVTYDRGQAQ